MFPEQKGNTVAAKLGMFQWLTGLSQGKDTQSCWHSSSRWYEDPLETTSTHKHTGNRSSSVWVLILQKSETAEVTHFGFCVCVYVFTHCEISQSSDFFLHGPRVWAQGLTHLRQVPYYWAIALRSSCERLILHGLFLPQIWNPPATSQFECFQFYQTMTE